MWFELAIEAGADNNYKEDNRRLAAEITPDQIAKAQQRAKEWRAKRENDQK